jgi:transposase
MPILTRQERERLVRMLYSQGKNIREIAKEARMSFRDIGVILNKVMEQENEGLKEVIKQQDNNNIDAAKEKEKELSPSTQAYKLFSEDKTPLEVSIALNLRESEATKFYKEYWNLKQLHTLNMVYEEVKDDIEPFLRLFKVAKAKGMGIQQVIDILKIANNDLPAIEERFKSLRNDVSMLQSQKHTCERNLYQLNNQIATTSGILNSIRISCERKRKEIENLRNEKAKLEATVTEFKNNNEEYLKIKQAAEENVKSVLMNGKILLQFATASVIESLRRNPELCNFVLNDISSNDTNTTSYGSNCPSLMSEQQQPFSYIDDDIYSALILEESEKLYNKFITKLTNNVLVAATAVRASLPPLLNQKDDRL